MDTLLDDYKRKLQTAEEFIRNNKNNGSIHDEKRAERLNTKAAEYRSFIVDIERAMARTKNENGALPIPDVSHQRELLLAFMGHIYCIGEQVFTGNEDDIIDSFLIKQ